MLKPEAAKARLAEWRLPEEENRLQLEVTKLPTKLRELAETIFELREEEDSTRPGDWQVREQRRHDATLELDRQSPDDRRKVFAVIAPHLSPSMEQTWQLLKTSPYQTGYERKAFRAPRHSHLAKAGLCSWIGGMRKLE